MTELDKILPAISKAMGAVKRIAKEGKNTHDNYSFASIDDFLVALVHWLTILEAVR